MAARRAGGKYNARRVVINGIRFASQAEARHYVTLRVRQAAGEISGLRCHPVYELQPAFTDSQGKRYAAIRYTADFEYTDVRTGRLTCCEVKGVRTRDWSMRERLFRCVFKGLVDLVVVPADEV